MQLSLFFNKNIFFLFIIFGCTGYVSVLYAQSPYVRHVLQNQQVSGAPPGYFRADMLRVNEQQQPSMLSSSLTHPSLLSSTGIFKFDSNGLPMKGEILATTAGALSNSLPISYKVNNNDHIVILPGGLGNLYNVLFLANLEESRYWAKAVSANNIGNRAKAAFLNDNTILTSYGVLEDGNEIIRDKGFARLNSLDGAQLWAYDYRAQGPFDEEIPHVKNIIGSSEDIAVVQGQFIKIDSFSYDYLLQINEDGDVKDSKIIHLPIAPFILSSGYASFSGIQDISSDNQGNIYVGGRLQKDTIIRYCGIQSVGNVETNAFIAKYNSDLELIWCKELIAENFDCINIKIRTSPEGEIFFTIITLCELPVIAGKLSTDGALQWVRGYEFQGPYIDISKDGSMSFMTRWKYFPDGSGELGVILARVGPDGELPSCPQFDACLWLEDMELTTEPLSWERSPGPLLPDLEVQTAEVEFESIPYCGTPPIPNSFFELPDTICLMECPVPDTLHNALAHAVKWEIEGPDKDTSFSSYNFDYCFDEPGMYLVRQTVWLLGCTESYEQIVEVLPPLEVSLGGDRIICHDLPALITPTSNRPLAFINWQNGSIQSALSIDSSGFYYITASDGYCVENDSVSLTLLRDTIALPIFDFTPKDTGICQQHLPYSLTINTPYDLSFKVNNAPIQGNTILLNKAGAYEVSTEVLGCTFSDSLLLATSDCPSFIYLPTAFSPNGDGRNDIYQPLGKFFEPIRLEVFGRWGGLLYQSEGSSLGWDGMDGEQPISTGYYVVVLHYINTRTGMEERIEQGVNLIR